MNVCEGYKIGSESARNLCLSRHRDSVLEFIPFRLWLWWWWWWVPLRPHKNSMCGIWFQGTKVCLLEVHVRIVHKVTGPRQSDKAQPESDEPHCISHRNRTSISTSIDNEECDNFEHIKHKNPFLRHQNCDFVLCGSLCELQFSICLILYNPATVSNGKYQRERVAFVSIVFRCVFVNLVCLKRFFFFLSVVSWKKVACGFFWLSHSWLFALQ